MKKWKKILVSAALFLGASLSLSACGNSGTSKESGDKTTVSVFNIKVETQKQLKALAKKYEKSHPNVKVNITTVGGGQDANSALQAKFSSGDEPAIFMLGGLADAKKWENKLTDLSDTKIAKSALEGTTEGATLNGKVYGIPLNIEGFGLLYNKEIFKKAGINTDKIKNFDNFKDAVKTLDSKKSSLGLDAVFGFSAKENWVVQQFSSYFFGPEFDNSLKKTYEAKTVDFKYGDQFKAYTDLINKYNVQPILSLDYTTSVEELFANDKVAMIHQGNWIVPTLDEHDKKFAQEKLGLLPMFVGKDEEPQIAAGPSWYWGVNKNKDKSTIKASKDFLNWMYRSKTGKKAIVDDFKYVPAYKGYDVNSITDPVSQDIYKQLKEGNVIPWVHSNMPDGAGWAQQQFFPLYQKYLKGSISWDSMVQQSQKLWKDDRANE